MEAVEIVRTRNCAKQPALWQMLNDVCSIDILVAGIKSG